MCPSHKHENWGGPIRLRSQIEGGPMVEKPPHSCGNSHAIWDYTVLFATGQR